MRALVPQRFRWARGAFAGYRRARARRPVSGRSSRLWLQIGSRCYRTLEVSPNSHAFRRFKRAGSRDGVAHQTDRRINAGAHVFSGIASALLKFGEIFLELGRIAVAIESAHDIHALDRRACDLDELLGVERL